MATYTTGMQVLSAIDGGLSAKDADLETITARLKKKESDYALLVQRHMELQPNQFGRKTEARSGVASRSKRPSMFLLWYRKKTGGFSM